MSMLQTRTGLKRKEELFLLSSVIDEGSKCSFQMLLNNPFVARTVDFTSKTNCDCVYGSFDAFISMKKSRIVYRFNFETVMTMI